MGNFNLRKFLAESKQVQEKVGTPQYGSKPGPDIFDPRAQDPTYGEGAEEAMEEIVAEYVQEALAGKDIKEVSGIIEAHVAKHAMELQMEVIAEVIDAYEGRLSEIKGSTYFKEMADEAKMSNQEGMIKGLHEMAASIKEEYKKAYMPEEKVDEGEEPIEEGKTIDGSTIKIAKGPVGSNWVDLLKKEKDYPVPPPLPPSVNDAVKAYLNDPKSNYEDFSKGDDNVATKAMKALASFIMGNKELSQVDKGYYINQFNTMVHSKKKSKPAPPPLPATAAKKGRVRAPKGTPPPPPPSN